MLDQISGIATYTTFTLNQGIPIQGRPKHRCDHRQTFVPFHRFLRVNFSWRILTGGFQFISISWRLRRYFPNFAITPFLPNFALFSELWQEAFDRVWSYQLAWLFNLQLRIIVFLSFRNLAQSYIPVPYFSGQDFWWPLICSTCFEGSFCKMPLI